MLRVPTMYPPFADMRTIQGALSSISAGFNPQLYNPGDPWRRVMNYPGIWIDIARIFRLGNETGFLAFVSACILGYLYSCYTLLKKSPSVYSLLAMLSGASLLAVERGNNDIVIFSLLAVALHLRRDWIRSIIVLLAVVLKVYPVFSIYGFFQKNIKLLMLTTLLSAIYLILNLNEMILIKSGNTAFGFLAYGVHLDAVKMVGLLLILVFSSFLFWKTGAAAKWFANGSDEYARDLFIVGGSIFVATFILSMNWDYRLIFLIFCLPYFQSLNNKLVKHVCSVSVLLSMNVLLMHSFGRPAINASKMSQFFLFAAIFVALSYELSLRTLFAKSVGQVAK
jgi:hypothetical protein